MTTIDDRNLSPSLTLYPSASLRELAILALPLIFILVCTNLTSFCDRVFLSRYSLEAFEGCVSASVLCLLFQIPCIRFASIVHVFVSQHKGTGLCNQIGQYVWQMIWFSLLSLLITLPLSFFIAPLYFSGTTVQDLGITYFQWMMYANFLFPLGSSISSFFIGLGKTRLVVFALLLSQAFHVFLDLLLIFGIPGILPPLGILGSVIAMIGSQTLFCSLLLWIFLRKKYRYEYNTANYRLNWNLLSQSLKIGLPSALGKLSVLLAWTATTKIMLVKGGSHLSVLTIGSTLTLLFLFINEGLGRAVTTVASYLIGAKRWHLLAWKLSRSVLLFLGVLFLILSVPFVFYPQFILSFFFPSLPPQEELALLYHTLFWVWIYAFTNGLSLLGVGLITATKQTFFYMAICHLSWVTCLVIFYGMNHFHWSADKLWLVMALDTLVAAVINILWVKKRTLNLSLTTTEQLS